MSLAFQCIASLGVLAWFESNRSEIVQNLCENRFQPNLHCDGQCVLMKKMKKIAKNQQNENSSERFIQIPAILLPNPMSIHFLYIDENDVKAEIPYQNNYNYLFLSKLKLPPKIHFSSIFMPFGATC